MTCSPDDERFKNAKKIIFAGLDNSGKTSINTVISENTANLGLIKPTYLIKRNSFQFLDYDMIACDMGGQKKYILSYMKEPGKFFGETDACIFVIDIQDSDRLVEATNYFKDILSQFSSLTISPGIFVLFHKAERILREMNVEDSNNMVTAQQIITEINAGRFNLEFHTTTIMDVWSITKAFAKVMNFLNPIGELLAPSLNALVTKVNGMIVVLMDEHMIPVVENVQTKQGDELISNAAPYMFGLKQQLDKIQQKSSTMVTFTWEDFAFILATNMDTQMPLNIMVIGNQGSIKKDMIEAEIASTFKEVISALKNK
jgi:hypothetical protein